jgi:hypothetical protein
MDTGHVIDIGWERVALRIMNPYLTFRNPYFK